MRIRLGSGQARRRLLSAARTALLLVVAGCGMQHTEQASTGSSNSTGSTNSTGSSSMGGSSAQQAVVTSTHHTPARGTASPSASAGLVHQVTLTDNRCVQFEPQWTTLRVGQSVSWHSELKTPVTIYVSPGVFARESYVVRPGGTVSSGPVLAIGRFSFWTEPSACQQAPHGVLASGPGVKVQEEFYASNP